MHKLILLLFMLIIPSTSFGYDLKLGELQSFSMDYMRLRDNKDPYFEQIKDEQWVASVSTNFDLDLVSYGPYRLIWNNRVHGESTQDQFRQIGWEYKLGFYVNPKVLFYWHHHSRHIMEQQVDGYRFPLYNAYGVRVIFYEK